MKRSVSCWDTDVVGKRLKSANAQCLALVVDLVREEMTYVELVALNTKHVDIISCGMIGEL